MMFAKRLVTRGVCNRESFFPKGSCFSGGDIGSFHQLEGGSFWANPCIPLAKASSLHPSFSSSQRAWEVELVEQSKCWSIICAGSNNRCLLGMTRGYVSKHGSLPRILFSRLGPFQNGPTGYAYCGRLIRARGIRSRFADNVVANANPF